MAETQPKRLREAENSSPHDEFDGSASNSPKRQKPYNNNDILNLLVEEEDEDEPSHEPSHELSQDLSAIFTTLQQELTASCDASITTVDFDTLSSTVDLEEAELLNLHATAADYDDDDGGAKADVMRHLLEASDDELGIPSKMDENSNNSDEIFTNSGENLLPFGFTDLWELEDEAANYYTVLQSELFM